MLELAVDGCRGQEDNPAMYLGAGSPYRSVCERRMLAPSESRLIPAFLNVTRETTTASASA